MKPVYKTPSHCDGGEKSIVWDHKEMGLARVVFHGENCQKESEEFCAKYRGFDKDE